MDDKKIEDSYKLYDEANELLLNDQFESATKLFSQVINKQKPSSKSIVYNCYIGRAQAYLKLERFHDAADDAKSGLALDDNDSKAYHKLGLAQFNLKDYENALETLKKGQAFSEYPAKKILFDECIKKCLNALPTQKSVKLDSNPVNQVIKHEWFQSESKVTVTIYAKNIAEADIKIDCTENKLIIKSVDTSKTNIDFSFNLEHPVNPTETVIKFMSTKIEIILKKCDLHQWKSLSITTAELENRINEKKPNYPSSSKKTKDWDKLAKEVDAEEEKLEGDAALNKLFRDVYANGNDETRKAMNKSFVESGGTTLSTNWSEVGSKKLDIKPPDGMEWKKY